MSKGVFLNNSSNISTQDILCVEVRLLPRLSHFTTRKPLLLRACRRTGEGLVNIADPGQHVFGVFCLGRIRRSFHKKGQRFSARAEKAHFENTSFRNTSLAPY